jgi:two-component system phosphate regulon sensor histidine kinase PhoR
MAGQEVVMSFLEVLLSIAVLILAARLYAHRRYLRLMLDWISGPLDAPLPDADGVWGEFVSRMNSRIKIRKREKTELAAALEQFRSAMEALPDGVIFMDTQRRILWMNRLAEDLMFLSQNKDSGKPIEHMIREPEFVSYLQHADFSEPLMYHPTRRDEACYMVSVIDYGHERSLMTIRDLTQLEKLENVRRDFVANVSHELKTPLTVISGFIETLQAHHTTLPDDKRQRYLDLAHAQALQMNRLVQDLLTLSSLEASTAFADETAVNIDRLAQDALISAESLSAGRHQIHCALPPDLRIRGSASALRSIISNLVNNAVNYTPEGGQIDIGWEHTASGGCLFVKDTGIGIPPNHLPRLTERFYRVDQGRSRDTGGTGLGLAIVKHALSRHQGALHIDSEPQVGSTFSACFPAQRISYTTH